MEGLALIVEDENRGRWGCTRETISNCGSGGRGGNGATGMVFETRRDETIFSLCITFVHRVPLILAT